MKKLFFLLLIISITSCNPVATLIKGNSQSIDERYDIPFKPNQDANTSIIILEQALVKQGLKKQDDYYSPTNPNMHVVAYSKTALAERIILGTGNQFVFTIMYIKDDTKIMLGAALNGNAKKPIEARAKLRDMVEEIKTTYNKL